MKTNINYKKIIEQALFSSKWVLVPFYLCLLLALVFFLRVPFNQIFEFIKSTEEIDPTESVLFALELIDVVMIAALIRMIIIGGYTSFVSKPEYMSGEKSSSGVLKVKLSTALIGVSSIHLLKTFIKCDLDKTITWDVLNMQMAIHASFLAGSIVLAIVDYLHVKAESIHHTDDELSHSKETTKETHIEHSRH